MSSSLITSSNPLASGRIPSSRSSSLPANFMNATSNNIALNIIRRWENATKFRGNWEAQWEEIARRIMPGYAFTFTNKSYNISQGQRKTEEMVDPTGALALPKFAAAMESMLTPRNQTWHNLIAADPVLKRNKMVRMWYDDLNQALFRYRYAPTANFASQQHECYMNLGAFGSAIMYIDRLRAPGQKGIRYRSVHLGEAYFLENFQGIIDTVIWKYALKARQALQKWPDSLPDDIRAAATDPSKQDTDYWFIQCVCPRYEIDSSYDPNRLDAKGMRYGSYHVSITGDKLVGEGGYRVFPFPVSRYVVAPGEVYGRSPAMMALPSIKTLNEEKKTVLKQGHRAVDPVLLAHDDGIIDSFSMTPGYMNFGGVTADGKPLIHALPVGDLSLAKEMMDMERATINDAFLVTLFQILIDSPTMTATEVLERARERGALLSPTMGRQTSEFLGPMVDREIDVLDEQKLLPRKPLILQQAQAEWEKEIIYDSPLSRMQRAEQGSGLMNYLNWLKDIVAVTQDPSPLDYIDWDTASPELAQLQAVPARWIKDQNAVNQVRAQRAQQAQQQQMMENAPAMAGVAKALPGLKLGGQFGGQ